MDSKIVLLDSNAQCYIAQQVLVHRRIALRCRESQYDSRRRRLRLASCLLCVTASQGCSCQKPHNSNRTAMGEARILSGCALFPSIKVYDLFQSSSSKRMAKTTRSSKSHPPSSGAGSTSKVGGAQIPAQFFTLPPLFRVPPLFSEVGAYAAQQKCPKIDSCSLPGDALTNCPYKLRLNFFLRPGGCGFTHCTPWLRL